MITDVEEFFTKGCGRCDRFATPDCSTRAWLPGLLTLRQLCREAGLQEAAKWGHPCYVHAGRNIAIIGAFRADFRLTFFNAALMQDPLGLLERQGQATRHPDMIRFTDNACPAELAPAILQYLKEAMGYAEAGLRPPSEVEDLELPEELIAALDDDPELSEAFRALTPGRRRSYVLHLTSTENPATRRARIEKSRSRILAGKGANER